MPRHRQTLELVTVLDIGGGDPGLFVGLEVRRSANSLRFSCYEVQNLVVQVVSIVKQEVLGVVERTVEVRPAASARHTLSLPEPPELPVDDVFLVIGVKVLALGDLRLPLTVDTHLELVAESFQVLLPLLKS